MAAPEPCNFDALNSEMIVLKLVQGIISWKKIEKVFILPIKFKSDALTSHKHGLAAKTLSIWRTPKSPLSRRIALG